MTNLHEEIVKHLKGDVKLYGSESKEDKKLIKAVTKSKPVQKKKEKKR
jgi:hypothetical protein